MKQKTDARQLPLGLRLKGELVDPNDIDFVPLSGRSNRLAAHHQLNLPENLPGKVAVPQSKRHRQAVVVFPDGPPSPLAFNHDDDLPVCDNSGQVVQQVSVGDISAAKASSGGSKTGEYVTVSAVKSLNNQTEKAQGGFHNFAQLQNRTLQKMAANQVSKAKNQTKLASAQGQAMAVKSQGRNNSGGGPIQSVDLCSPVSLEQLLQPVIELTSSTKGGTLKQLDKPSLFSQNFPQLNEQAIEMLVRQSEPETALDLLKQALQELNCEKKIEDGMPHYQHTLLPKVTPTQQQFKATEPGSKKPVDTSTLLTKALVQTKITKPLASSKAQRQQQQAKALVNHQSSSKNKDQDGHLRSPTTAKQKVDQSTKSNSTCDPSATNLPATSSLKSSILTSPKSLSTVVISLTQTELKDRTKESNLIVCLYYNLACCYQRLGLLEESVEYLEFASDQLEDTIQYFQVQEDNLIKAKQLQSHQRELEQDKERVKVAVSQYATEQPTSKTNRRPTNSQPYLPCSSTTSQHRGGGKKNGVVHQQAEYMRTQQSRLLPSSGSLAGGKRRLSVGGNLNTQPGQSGSQPTTSLVKVTKRTDSKREKISIKDCQASPKALIEKLSPPNVAHQRSPSSQGSQGSQPPSTTNTNPLQRMSQGASQLSRAGADLQVSQDHLINLHNSAEQLVQTKTSSMLPPRQSANQLQYASFTNNYSSLIEKQSSSGRNVSPVTSASLQQPPDSTVFSTSNPLLGCQITIEQLLAEKMHKSRYQCKMNLQICALQSQLGKHQDALIYGRKAAQICFKLIKNAQLLCKRYVQQIQRHIQARQAKRTSQTQLGTTTLPDQSSESPQPSRNAARASKACTEINDSFEDDYQAAQFYRKAPKTRMDTASNSSTGFTMSNKYANRAGSNAHNTFKRPRSSCSSANSSRSTSTKGLTRLRLSRHSIGKMQDIERGSLAAHRNSKLLEGSRSSRESATSCRESSTESLDRIHTFNLKNTHSLSQSKQSVQQEGANSEKAALVYGETSTQPAPGKEAKYEIYNGLKVALVDGPLLKPEKADTLKKFVEEGDLLNSGGKGVAAAAGGDKSGTQSVVTQRNVYVEESVKVLESLIIQADPLLQELASIVKEFEDKSQKSAIDRDQDLIKKYGQMDFRDRRKRLKISFTTLQELVNIERDQRFKLNVRNTLGVKNSQDWIFNLNIGNVMHLNMMKEQELNAKIENTHELTKDTMLEKVVLITSAYFCIATEIRFILQKDLLDVKLITKKDSESFHAKALHIALLFLPEDCPLSQYIHQTYCKNYLQPKLKLQKQRNAYISQKMAKQHQTRQKQIKDNQAEQTHRKADGTRKHQFEVTRRRPSTVLVKETTTASSAIEKAVLESLGGGGAQKLLISTKSYEGLSSSKPDSSTMALHKNTTPRTTTHSQQQMALLRRLGATPDHAAAHASKNMHHAKSSNLMTKVTRPTAPSISLQKKLKRTKEPALQKQVHPQTTTAAHRATTSQAVKRMRSPTQQSSGPHFTFTKPSKVVHHHNPVPSGQAKPESAASVLAKARDSSSSQVRKIKIDLGLLCNQQSPERAAQRTLLSAHQRSTSLKKGLQKKSSVQGSAANQTTSVVGIDLTAALGVSSLLTSTQKTYSLLSKKVSTCNQTVTTTFTSQQKASKLHLQQVKQSMGDQSNTCTTRSTAFINQRPSVREALPKRGTSGSLEKQQAIMVAALKSIKLKQSAAAAQTNVKRHNHI